MFSDHIDLKLDGAELEMRSRKTAGNPRIFGDSTTCLQVTLELKKSQEQCGSETDSGSVLALPSPTGWPWTIKSLLGASSLSSAGKQRWYPDLPGWR